MHICVFTKRPVHSSIAVIPAVWSLYVSISIVYKTISGIMFKSYSVHYVAGTLCSSAKSSGVNVQITLSGNHRWREMYRAW